MNDAENAKDANACIDCDNSLYEVNLTEEKETELELEAQQEMQSELGVQKPVTVLFASIKGFDYPLDADMDLIEEITATKSKLDNELDKIISKYGGVVDKIIRSFFMANFGTKVSHKNDPAYAVLSAIELVETVKKYGGSAHVGINSGLAWVGSIGTTGFTDNTSYGNTVNLSARLKGKAGKDLILVSPNTYELTKDLFEYDPRPPVSVKGITEPVPVFAVKGKNRDSEMIAAVKESEEERLKRLQEAIPPYLKEKALADKSRIQGERKQVTMLYSDISGFTAMSEKFKDNPGKMAEIMDLCHKTLGNIIYKYEGRIDQIVGDELMAIFGAPITHEDDPERAIRAGLEMLQEIKRFSEDIEGKMGIPPLDVHIGVNTGRVSIGQISDDAMRMDYTVIGEPVELAERLEDISERGEMVVGERTYRLTRALFDFDELEPVKVAGREIPIYKVIRMKDKPSLKRGDERLNKVAPVGRDEEFHTLKRLSEDLIDKGEGHFVCMIGQAGFGKSRLRRELKAELGDDVTWLDGACFAHTENTAYSIFQTVIKSHLDIRDTDSDEEIRKKLIREMNEMCTPLSPPPPDEIIPFVGNMLSVKFEGALGDKVRFLESDPEKLQRRTFVAVRDWLIAESQRKPVVLALEDLHWIDGVSLDLILFLMEDLWGGTQQTPPLLILCLYRPERLDRCWVIGDIAKEKIADKYTQIVLNKLSPELSRRLFNLLIDLREPPYEEGNGDTPLQDVILEKADGNPFYIEEILRTLMDDKVIVPQNPDDETNKIWIPVKNVVDIKVPDSLEQVMRARIDRIEDEPKLVLWQGSTIGRIFEYEILKGMIANEPEPHSQVDDESIYENLSKLVATDMIAVASDEPLEYIFGHIVTHTITYESIPGTKRREYHNRVGLTIEKLYADYLERFYERLAQQFRESNNNLKAAIYLTKAGTKARKQFSNKDAITFYQQALERIEDLEQVSDLSLLDYEIECHEGLGDIYRLTGEYDSAIEHYQKGLEKSESPVLRARFKRKIASVHEKRANWDMALNLFKEAQEEMGDNPDSVELAIIYNDMAQIYGYNKAEWTKAFEMGQEALNLIRNTENYDVMAAIYKNMGGYKNRLGEIDATTEYMEKALNLATRMGDKVLMAQIHNNLGTAIAVSDPKKAQSHFEQSIEIKRQIGDIVGIATAIYNIGLIYLRKKEFSKAMDYFNESLKIAEKAGALKTIALLHSAIAGIHSRSARSTNDPAARSKDYQKAVFHYRKSAEISQKIGFKPSIATGYVNMCNLYIEMKEYDKSMEIALKALKSAEESQVAQIIGHAHKNLGRIYHAKEQYDASFKEFEKAIEIVKKANATSDVAEFNHWKGEMLIDKGDIKGAKESLTCSFKLYKQLKMQKYAEEVEETLGRLQ